MVLCTSLSPDLSESNLFVPMASNSSMNIIAGDFSLAKAKASLIIFAPSPMNIYTSYGPANFKNVAFVWAAQALANIVFPVPGGPNNKTPLGGLIPIYLNLSAFVIGSTIASLNSSIYLSKPPISL